MRPDKAILTALARQMYEDIRFNAANAPTSAVDEDTTRLFNILLRMCREAYPGQAALEAFTDMTPRTIKFKDAMIVSGQLQTFLVFQSEGAPAARPPRTPSTQAMSNNTPPPSSIPSLAKPFNLTDHSSSSSGSSLYTPPASGAHSGRGDLEAELYGPNPPKRLNADGTVPFSLEDEE